MKSGGFLQPLSISNWKWEDISMDFIVGLPHNARKVDLIMPHLRTHLIHSFAYHPQMDGQTERVNQILEDMLRAYVMEHQGSWDKNFPQAEFSYNNSY
jgi:hypothetical protein